MGRGEAGRSWGVEPRVLVRLWDPSVVGLLPTGYPGGKG